MCDKLGGAMKMTVKDLAWCALLPPCYPFLPFIYTWAETSRDKPGNPPSTESWLQWRGAQSDWRLVKYYV